MNMTEFPVTEKMMPRSNRALILRSLVPIAVNKYAEHLEGFLAKFSEALRQHAKQKSRPVEAILSAEALTFLKKNGLQFYSSAPGFLTQLLIEEIDYAESVSQKKDEREGRAVPDTFDEIENAALFTKLSCAIELENATLLAAFNGRIAYLLQSRTTSTTRNPFRPETIVRALFMAWCDFYRVPESYRMASRLLRAEMFLQVPPMLAALNDSLITRGILVDQGTPAVAGNKANSSAGPGARRETSLSVQLRNLLPDDEDGMGDLSIPNLFPASSSDGSGSQEGTSLFVLASAIQKQAYLDDEDAPVAPYGTSVLQQLREQGASDMSGNQENTIELVTKIFEYIFQDPELASDIKTAIAPLQIPILKSALLNKDFFFRDTYPSRRLLESLVKAGTFWNPGNQEHDPLYQAIKNCVNQLKYEDEPLSDLFAAVLADFESFLSDEGGWSEIALTEPIAEALRQEKIRLSQEMGHAEVAARIETGEVAGFVEVFLEKYWVPILALAHSVKDDKPDALANAIKTMDDLIWSMKPKTSPEERKDMLAKLPSLLSLINAWLNTIKCDDLDRPLFFSRLAERHAAIVRSDLSLRGQIEFAVNVAEKVSERRLRKSTQEIKEIHNDKFTMFANNIALGDCVEFVQQNDVTKKLKLAWISSRRGLLLFSNHQGQDTLSITVEDLAQCLRVDSARLIHWTPVVERALAAAFAK